MKDKEAEELALAKIIDPWVFDIPEHLISGRMEMERRQYNAREAASRTLAHGYVLAAEERERVIEECAVLIEEYISYPSRTESEMRQNRKTRYLADALRALSSQSTKGETE